ncbi:helix-turn-helix domain-containing protein [Xiamenia xianingshaonis]|uniref:Helix-turn-helix domain-containing protein n=1 Tax=Xiamenia xianingshaonis TaxID=2682776 RepID=A0ABX0IIS7_9ACTN|nr:AraC family transcriptional regulator [Xiamenia xianingshaonis]NHM14746.1 helix-turn-helix domain-containing protein [Xiamenia xianingshaonis]
MDGINSYVNLGENVACINHNGIMHTYRVTCEDGQGIMTMYELYPGMTLSFHDFVGVASTQSTFRLKGNVEMLCLSYCREGRIEWDVAKDESLFLGAGDIGIDDHKMHSGNFSFPLKYYRGITASFEVDVAQQCINQGVLSGFSVDIKRIQAAFCRSSYYKVVKQGASVLDHVFSEIYTAPDIHRETYLRIKLLELLFLLDSLSSSSNAGEDLYLRKSQIEKVHAIQEAITRDLGSTKTLKQLSEEFDFPYVSMQTCFKQVYGMSIHSYLVHYRMSQASRMLRESDVSIGEIALSVGYANASKFSSAFKEATGFTPREFRARALSEM